MTSTLLHRLGRLLHHSDRQGQDLDDIEVELFHWPNIWPIYVMSILLCRSDMFGPAACDDVLDARDRNVVGFYGEAVLDARAGFAAVFQIGCALVHG